MKSNRLIRINDAKRRIIDISDQVFGFKLCYEDIMLLFCNIERNYMKFELDGKKYLYEDINGNKDIRRVVL